MTREAGERSKCRDSRRRGDVKEGAGHEDGPALGSPGGWERSQAWTLLRPGVPNSLASGQPLSTCLLAPEACRAPGQPSPAVGLAWVTLSRAPSPGPQCGTLTARQGKGFRQRAPVWPPKASARS